MLCCQRFGFENIVTQCLLPPATKLGQGNIFRSVCQEFCPQGGGGMCSGGHAWQGVCVVGACMAGGVGTCMAGACIVGRHAWWGGACVAGGMHGRGACMEGVCVWQGEHVWQGGMCGRGRAWQILRDTVNERAVRILLECMLV